MGIFKCLQSLRHYSRSSRLFQCVGIVALVCGITLFSKKLTLKEQAGSCLKDNQVELFFYTSKPLTSRIHLPLTSAQSLRGLSFLESDVQGTTWKMAALETFSIGDILAELSMNNAARPLIAFVRDSVGAEYLVVYNEEKQISLSSVKHLVQHNLVEQNKENVIKVAISNPKNDEQPISLCIAMYPTK